MPSTFRFRRRHLWLLPALLLLLPIGLSLKWVWADVHYWQGKLRLDQWREQGRFEAAEWQLAHDGAQRALELNPDNGDYRELMAHIWLWRGRGLPWEDPDALVSHATALVHFRSAVEARPNWPYTWSRLADMKRRLWQFDAEFEQAIRQAATLGPWEPGVQLMLGHLLMDHQDQLDAELQALIIDRMGRGLRHPHPMQRGNMFRLLRNTPWLETACALPEVRAANPPVPGCQRFYSAPDNPA